MRRYILALTAGEMSALRVSAQLDLDGDDLEPTSDIPSHRRRDAWERAHLRALAAACAKIDAAETLRPDDLSAYDYAAGDMMDTDRAEARRHQRDAGVRGNPYRARGVIARAMKGGRK